MDEDEGHLTCFSAWELWGIAVQGGREGTSAREDMRFSRLVPECYAHVTDLEAPCDAYLVQLWVTGTLTQIPIGRVETWFVYAN